MTPHFSHLTYHITSHTSLITSQLITAPLLTHSPITAPLLTPHFSHHNPSQLYFSHHLSHTLFDTLSFTHHLLRTQLCHPPSFTHHFVTHTHTIFYTQLSHTPSFTYHFSHTALLHTSLHTPFFTHIIFHTTLSHTVLPPPLPLFFLLSPSPQQHFWLIIGRSWLVGLSGPFIFRLAPATPLRVRPPPCPSLIIPHSLQHYLSHLTHHSPTHHTSIITALPITPHSSHLCHNSTTHHTTCQSHHAVVWQAQYTEPPGEAAARVGAAGPRLAFVWQAQYTAPSGGAAARVVAGWPAWPAADFRAAGALCRAFWRSCCARGRRLARGWRSYGRRSTQGLLEELLRTWSPPGPQLAFVWQAQYTEPSGGAAARAVACWPVGYVNVPWGSRDKRRCENWCLASSWQAVLATCCV